MDNAAGRLHYFTDLTLHKLLYHSCCRVKLQTISISVVKGNDIIPLYYFLTICTIH